MFDTRFVLPLAQLRPTTTSPMDAAATTAPAISAAPTDASSMAPAASATTAPAGVATTAAGGGAGGVATEPVAKPSQSSPLTTMLLLGGMFVVLYFVMFHGQRKTEKARKAMIQQMKKGDRVMTVGGLVARIVSIDEDEVVLKIDESANVKATYKKSSIQQVLETGDKK